MSPAAMSPAALNPAATPPAAEQTLRFGTARHLIGTLSVPRPPSGGRLGLVLLNAGVVHRIGPHRLNVRLAREAAANGISSIRFDLPGLGDSGFSAERTSHDEQALSAVSVAIDQLATASGARRFVVAGLCSGADAGYLAAQRDDRIAGLFMIEPYYFPDRLSALWRGIRRVREYGFAGTLGQLAQRLPGPAADVTADQAAADFGAPDPDNQRQTPTPEAFTAGLAALARRGVGLRLVYANSSMGRFDLASHHRRIFDRLPPDTDIDVTMLPGTDHLLTPVHAKRAVAGRLVEWLRALDARHEVTGS